MLDLPGDRAAELDSSLQLLRDYADGLLFPPEEVARESGVVISELNARDSGARRAGIQWLNVVFAGTRLPEREVSGVAGILQRATADQLRSFYVRNYQPNRMTVVLVGAINPADGVEKIRTAFASMPIPSTPTAAAEVPSPPAPAGVKGDVLIVPTAKGAPIRVASLGARPPDTVEGRRQELAARLATAAFYTRLRARRDREHITQFGPPRVVYQPIPFGSLAEHLIELPASVSSWDDAIALVESELHRARDNGFTKAEVAEAGAGQLTFARTRLVEFSGQPAARIAADIAADLMNERTWLLPAQQLAETQSVLSAIEPSEVSAEINHLFPRDSIHVVVSTSPEHPLKADRVASVYTKSAARSVKTRNEKEEALAFNYRDFGKPGAIAKQDRVEDLDLTLVTFANDVRLNVHPSKFDQDRFRLRVVFASNYSDVPANAGGVAELAGQLLLNSDFKRQPQGELVRLLKLHGVSPQLAVQNGTPVLTMAGPAEELAFGLQFLTALLSDLVFDQDHYRVSLSNYGSLQRSVATTPGPFALRAAFRAYAGNDPRLNLGPPEAFASDAGFDLAAVWLRDHVLGGPLEIGLVGKFDPEEAIKIAAATVGTLSKRSAARHGSPLTTPTKALRQAGSANLPASTSLSCVLWPVILPNDPKSNAALSLAVDVLRDREMLVLRESLGATYSPDARIHRDAIQRDFAFVAMINTFEPAQSDKLSLVSLGIGARLAEKGASVEEFNRLMEPAKTRRAQDLRNDGYWVNMIAVAQSRPEVLDEIRVHTSVLDEISIQDVNRAAQVFKPDRFVSILLHPASANIPKPSKR